MNTRIIFFISLFLFLYSCKKENQPPEIQNITASPTTIKINETSQLSCAATDLDGDQLAYIWSSSEGTFPDGTNTNTATWKAPGKSGNYSISVSVNDGKNIVDGEIDVSVESKLLVSPDSLDFGTKTTEQSFDITNTGTGTLAWTISESIDWLTVSPRSGNTTMETDRVTVKVNRDELSPGSYSGTISISTKESQQDVSVTIQKPEGTPDQINKTYIHSQILVGTAGVKGELPASDIKLTDIIGVDPAKNLENAEMQMVESTLMVSGLNKLEAPEGEAITLEDFTIKVGNRPAVNLGNCSTDPQGQNEFLADVQQSTNIISNIVQNIFTDLTSDNKSAKVSVSFTPNISITQADSVYLKISIGGTYHYLVFE